MDEMVKILGYIKGGIYVIWIIMQINKICPVSDFVENSVFLEIF